MTFKGHTLIFIAALISLTSTANANIVNFRIDTQMGLMFEIGIKRFGIAYETFNAGISTFTSNVNITTQGGRISLYSHPMGEDAWYLGVDGGQLKASATTYSLFSGTQTGSGSAVGTYTGAALGYHWFFWKTLNMNLGVEYLSGTLSSLTTHNGAGAAVQTVNIPTFSGAGVEFGLGLSF